MQGYSYVREAEKEIDGCFSENLIHRAARELGCRIILSTPSASFFPFWGQRGMNLWGGKRDAGSGSSQWCEARWCLPRLRKAEPAPLQSEATTHGLSKSTLSRGTQSGSCWGFKGVGGFQLVLNKIKVLCLFFPLLFRNIQRTKDTGKYSACHCCSLLVLYCFQSLF